MKLKMNSLNANDKINSSNNEVNYIEAQLSPYRRHDWANSTEMESVKETIIQHRENERIGLSLVIPPYDE